MTHAYFTVTIKHFLQECSFYEIIRILEKLDADEIKEIGKHAIRFRTYFDLKDIINHFLEATSVEYLFKEISEDLRDFSKENLEENVLNLLKSGQYLNIEILDFKKILDTNGKRYIKRHFIEKLNTIIGSFKLSRRKPSLSLYLLVVEENKVTVNLLIKSFRRDRFKYRSPEKRVYFQSSALTPQSSILLLNLSLRNKDAMLDPFCGTGSILIESALHGNYAIGIDIDYKMVTGARRNTRQYNVHHLVDIVLADSLLIPLREKSITSIATDPPYGRLASTKGRTREKVIEGLLRISEKTLKPGGRCAFFLPKGTQIYNSNKLRKICSIYLHSDLTREVWVYTK